MGTVKEAGRMGTGGGGGWPTEESQDPRLGRHSQGTKDALAGQRTGTKPNGMRCLDRHDGHGAHVKMFEHVVAVLFLSVGAWSC